MMVSIGQSGCFVPLNPPTMVNETVADAKLFLPKLQ
jgi:hypothetical protein